MKRVPYLRLILVLVGLGCVAAYRPWQPDPHWDPESEEVVATVNSEEVLLADVRPHLRPAALRIGPTVPKDPRALALAAAQRQVLFAQEAERRGLGGGREDPIGRARAVQTLIEDELDRQGVPLAAELTREYVQAMYERRIEVFSAVRRCRISALVTQDAGAAEALLAAAVANGTISLSDLGKQYSADDVSLENGGWIDDDSGEWLDPLLVRLALNLRRAGEVGVERATDGRYYVLRALEVELDVAEFDSRTEIRVRNLLVEERREEALAALQEQLESVAEIAVSEEVLDRLQIPMAPQPLGGSSSAVSVAS